MLKTLTWVRALGPEDLPEDSCATVEIAGHRLCMARVGGRFGAIDDRCPHRGASLGAGFVHEGQVICPLHGWEFDPFTAQLRGGYPSGLAAHRTEVRDDGVYVALRVVETPGDKL
jgi:nitrite reductase/ring-hydroxylating ferredoxin subunit